MPYRLVSAACFEARGHDPATLRGLGNDAAAMPQCTMDILKDLAPTGTLRASINLGNPVLAQGTEEDPSGVGALLAGPAASIEGATAEAIVSLTEQREPPRHDRDDRVSSYSGPLSSPWAVPLPKTVAEARSLGERPLVGVERPLTVEAFLQYLVGVWVLRSADAVRQNSLLKDALGEVGLIIDAEGRWAALIEADGELHRSIG